MMQIRSWLILLQAEDCNQYQNLSDKIKWEFFQVLAVLVLPYGYATWTFNEMPLEKARRELYKDAICCFSYKIAVVWWLTSETV